MLHPSVDGLFQANVSTALLFQVQSLVSLPGLDPPYGSGLKTMAIINNTDEKYGKMDESCNVVHHPDSRSPDAERS